MRLNTIVRSEMFERKNQLSTCFIAICLGVGVMVASKNILMYSEKAVAKELDALGANILILPKSATLQDYYSADMQDEAFPEEYVDRLVTSDMQGLDNLSPKLSKPVEISGRKVILTGILPKNEFQAKASWQDAGIFSRPTGCGTVVSPIGAPAPEPKETLLRKRVIETLGEADILVGGDVAASLKLKEGDKLPVLGQEFKVLAVLSQTGTVDDSRVFAHLHTVQRLAGKPALINAIEVVGCCKEISNGLVQKINRLLPEAKVVTITQIVDTQIRTNTMMSRLSLLFLVIITIVGGASIANYMYANVYERRREIGTLIALGAESAVVVRMFLLKAVYLGLAGGVVGYIAGTLVAIVSGPYIAGIAVLPVPWLALPSVGAALAITLAASYFPSRKAAKLDPCQALQEV